MSRSYKKNPVCTDNRSSGANKRIANRITRRKTKGQLYQGGDYKKLYESWDICDYKWYETKQEAIEAYKCNRYGIADRYKSLEHYLHDCWYKYNKRK